MANKRNIAKKLMVLKAKRDAAQLKLAAMNALIRVWSEKFRTEQRKLARHVVKASTPKNDQKRQVDHQCTTVSADSVS